MFLPQLPLEAQVTSLTAAQAGEAIRSEPGVKVVLLYKIACPYSHAMFPEVVRLAERYSALGVSFLAFSIDPNASGVERYLRDLGYPFAGFHIQPWQPGELIAALQPSGIDVRSRLATPHIAVIDAAGRLIGQARGTGGARRADQWLKSLGLRPQGD